MLDYYVSVVYGVKETPAMRRARTALRVEEQIQCPKCGLHPFANKAAFCVHCGTELSLVETQVSFDRHPAEVYAAPGLDPASNDHDYDIMVNKWVHTCRDRDNSVVLGLSLLHKDARRDLGVTPLLSPTKEQERIVQDYLSHLGITETPRLYLVLRVL